MVTSTDFCKLGRAVIQIEKDAVEALDQRIDERFSRACQFLLGCRGRIVVTGMGKSGHIGGKIAATLASTGSPSFFVHPGEASHGDLGMLTSNDVVLALSNSGETGEILTLLPIIKRLGVPLIAMTGNTASTLAKASDVALDVSVEKEACPLGLAPTSSTTVCLVMGDALAIALLEAGGFTADDFALSHPGGSLGRRLLLRIDDIMHREENLPKVPAGTKVRQALDEMTNKGLGMTTVVNETNELLGIFTDGDLRRMLDNNKDVHSTVIESVMTEHPQTAQAGLLAAEALKLMESHKINGLIIVDECNRPVGALNMQDMLRAGVM